MLGCGRGVGGGQWKGVEKKGRLDGMEENDNLVKSTVMPTGTVTHLGQSNPFNLTHDVYTQI